MSPVIGSGRRVEDPDDGAPVGLVDGLGGDRDLEAVELTGHPGALPRAHYDLERPGNRASRPRLGVVRIVPKHELLASAGRQPPALELPFVPPGDLGLLLVLPAVCGSTRDCARPSWPCRPVLLAPSGSRGTAASIVTLPSGAGSRAGASAAPWTTVTVQPAPPGRRAACRRASLARLDRRGCAAGGHRRAMMRNFANARASLLRGLPLITYLMLRWVWPFLVPRARRATRGLPPQSVSFAWDRLPHCWQCRRDMTLAPRLMHPRELVREHVPLARDVRSDIEAVPRSATSSDRSRTILLMSLLPEPPAVIAPSAATESERNSTLVDRPPRSGNQSRMVAASANACDLGAPSSTPSAMTSACVTRSARKAVTTSSISRTAPMPHGGASVVILALGIDRYSRMSTVRPNSPVPLILRRKARSHSSDTRTGPGT